MILIAAGLFILILWFYILFVREYLVAHWPQTWKWWHEEVEDRFWEKSRSILVGRAYQVGGWLLGIQTLVAAAGVDTTPFTQELANFFPEKYRPLILAGWMIITGIAVVWLRRQSTTSVEEIK